MRQIGEPGPARKLEISLKTQSNAPGNQSWSSQRGSSAHFALLAYNITTFYQTLNQAHERFIALHKDKEAYGIFKASAVMLGRKTDRINNANHTDGVVM